MFASGEITAAMMRTITEQTTTRIGEIDARMAHRDRERVLGDLVRSHDEHEMWTKWKDYSLDRKQAVLRELGTWTIQRGKPGGSPKTNRYAGDARVVFGERKS